jgi:molybdopterin/thiamine biosynthesis adenylyltransferase/rhodanese-related sulfurtransferase
MQDSTKNGFSPEEYARYSRHIIIPEFGLEAQQKLRDARVLVIGSGGLGSPMLLYLAAAGVGHIGIVDFDVVDDSNLQRQVLFTTEDVGLSKARQAKERIQKLNPHIRVTVHELRLDSSNAREIIRAYDVVADGTDNFPTRYLVNDACVLEGKVNVYASIFQFEGQVSVFNYLQPNGERGPNYRDLFPEPPPPGLVPSCAEGGVLGVLPGILGSMQALEVIKVVTGVGEPLVGRIFLFDAASFETRFLKVRKQPDTRIEKLIDYQVFCGLGQPEAPVQEISVEELAAWQKAGRTFQLIDVREPYEYEIAQIGGELIPLAQVEASADRLRRDVPVVVHCRSGVRSARAIRSLQALGGFDNLHNLAGGILAYAEKVDSSLTRY